MVGENQDDPTHSAVYGLKFAEAADRHKVTVIVKYPDSPKVEYPSQQAFLIAKLKAK